MTSLRGSRIPLLLSCLFGAVCGLTMIGANPDLQAQAQKPNILVVTADDIFYNDWMTHRIFVQVPAQAIVANWLSSFKDYPNSAKTSRH